MLFSMSAVALLCAMAFHQLATATASAGAASVSVTFCGDLLEVAVEIAVVVCVFLASSFVFKKVRPSKPLGKAATGRCYHDAAKPFVKTVKAPPQVTGKFAKLKEVMLADAAGPLPGAEAVFARCSQMGELCTNLEDFLQVCTDRAAWSVAARAIAMGPFDDELSTDAYNTIMQGFATSGELPSCVKLCKDMRVKGLEPSCKTYGILLDACLNCHDYHRAQSLLLDISKAGLQIDASQCSKCVRGLVALGEQTEAEELVSALESKFDDASALVRMKDLLRVASLRPRKHSSAAPVPLSPQGARRRDGSEAGSWRDRHSPTQAVGTPPRSGNAVRLSQYIDMNALDSNCAQLLQKLTPAQADWVMDQEFLINVDASKGSAAAKAVAAATRAKQKPAEFWSYYPTKEDLSRRLAAYVQANGLDRRCAATLEQLSEENLTEIMNQEFIVAVDPSRGTASSKVIWQVLRMRQGPP